MHPHQTAVAEGVAVVIAEGTFGGSSYVGEDQRGCRLGGNSLEVYAVPCRSCRCEYAGLGTKLGVSVVSNTETIALQED
jgi:hypothetical protein